MQYRIGQIAKISGFSASGIRYLEKIGFLRPSMNENNTQRQYTQQDVASACCYKSYSAFPFSKEDLLQLRSSNLQEISKLLEKNMLLMEKELLQQQLLIANLAQRLASINSIEEMLEKCKVMLCPADYFLPVTLSDTENSDISSYNSRWSIHFPFSYSSLSIPKQVLMGESQLQPTMGFAIQESDFYTLCPQCYVDMLYRPQRMSVYTVLRTVNENLMLDSDRFDFVRNYFEQNRFKPSGNGQSRAIITHEEDGNFVRYDAVWFPFEKLQ